MTYALDTNVVIEILSRNKVVCENRDNAARNGDKLIIPIITDYEIMRGFYYRPASARERLYRSMRDRYSICRLNDKIWKRGAKIYADLRRKGRTADDADILIAAMCVENNYTLVTHNNKHFDGIEDLLKVDWQGVLSPV